MEEEKLEGKPWCGCLIILPLIGYGFYKIIMWLSTQTS
jgi:hypothetical protein